MGNALVRASIREVKVKFNGDPNDGKVKASATKLKTEVEALEADWQAAKKEYGEASREARDALALLRPKLDALREAEKKRDAEDNVIAASLVYPRSGASQLLVARAANLQSGEKPWPAKAKDSLYDRVLFKEEIQGETRLVVAISDKDPKSGIVRFFRGVASALFATLTGGAVGSLSGVVAAATAGQLQSFIGTEIKGGSKKERVTVIARSAEVDLEIAEDGAVLVRNANGSTIVYDEAKSVLTLTLLAPDDLDTGKAIQGTKKIKKGASNGSIVLQLDGELL